MLGAGAELFDTLLEAVGDIVDASEVSLEGILLADSDATSGFLAVASLADGFNTEESSSGTASNKENFLSPFFLNASSLIASKESSTSDCPFVGDGDLLIAMVFRPENEGVIEIGPASGMKSVGSDAIFTWSPVSSAASGALVD
jgi:hypothetical protein